MIFNLIKEDANGKRFYDHELTEIENLDSPRRSLPESQPGATSLDRQGDVMNIVRHYLSVKPDKNIINIRIKKNAF